MLLFFCINVVLKLKDIFMHFSTQLIKLQACLRFFNVEKRQAKIQIKKLFIFWRAISVAIGL